MSEKRKIAWSFILGLVLGGALVFTGNHFCRHYGRMGLGFRGWHRDLTAKRILDKFGKKLNLDPDQRAKIELILDAKLKKMKELRETVKPQFKSLRESTQAEIRALLRPDQQAKFDEIARDFEKRREKMEVDRR